MSTSSKTEKHPSMCYLHGHYGHFEYQMLKYSAACVPSLPPLPRTYRTCSGRSRLNSDFKTTCFYSEAFSSYMRPPRFHLDIPIVC